MELRHLLEQCYRASLAAIHPRGAVAAALPDLLPAQAGRIVVLALGKAAVGMAWGVADVVEGPLTGVVVSDHPEPVPQGLRLIVGGHPLPDEGSLEGGDALLGAALGAGPGELALCLVSGGGSALAEAPAAGVTLADLRATNDLLLRSGATIDEVNAVRTSLSRLKGGGLAAAIDPAPCLTLIISDVVGDRLDVIGSGPTVARPGVAGEAREVLLRRGIIARAPASVVAALDAEPPARATGDTIEIVASRRHVAAAAAEWLKESGLSAELIDTDMTGESAAIARDVLAAETGAQVAVCAGETTVTVTGDGIGGRNHEAALAAAIELDGSRDRAFLAAGTDGIDGFTDGAGAVVDGATAPEARRLGLDAGAFLERNDSGGFFDRVPGRIVTGPTGTNVGDLWLVADLSRRDAR